MFLIILQSVYILVELIGDSLKTHFLALGLKTWKGPIVYLLHLFNKRSEHAFLAEQSEGVIYV